MLQTQVAELAQTKVESTTRFPVKLFGTVHAGVFANSANANWLDNPNIVAAPPADGHAGHDEREPAPDAHRLHRRWPDDRLGAHQRGRRDGFLRRHPGLPDRAGDGAAAPARRLRAHRGRADGARSGPGSRDSRAARSDLARGLLRFRCCSDRAISICARRRCASSARSRRACARRPASSRRSAATSSAKTTCSCRRRSAASDRAVPACRRASPTQPARRPTPRLVDIGRVGAHRLGAPRQRRWPTAGRRRVDFAARRDVVGVAGELFVGDNADAFGGATGLDARSAGGWGELQLFPSSRVSFTAGVRRRQRPRQTGG